VSNVAWGPEPVADAPVGLRPRRLLAVALLATALLSLDVLRALPSSLLGKAVLLSFANALVKVLLWAAVALLVFRACRRFPLGARPRTTALVIHVACWLATSAAVALLSHPLQALIRPALFAALPAEAPRRLTSSWTGTPDRSPWFTVGMALPWDQLTYWAILAGAMYAQGSAAARRCERRRLELERALSSARLSVLETQLQPHFLFNALHTISALVAGSPATARAVTRRLRDLLGRLLAANQSVVQPLAEELAFLEDYLAIQKARFGDRLSLVVEVPPECLGIMVPSLLLQPLVENAIRHGAARRAGATRIAVRAWREDGRLELEVHDDGPGVCGSGSAGAGVGLDNTRRRLEQLHGPEHRFDFQPSALPWGGARVRVGLPLRPPVALSIDAEAASHRRSGARLWLAPWLLFAVVIILQHLGTCAAIATFSAQVGGGFVRTFVGRGQGVVALILLFPLVYGAKRFIDARGRSGLGRVAMHVPGPILLCLAKAALAHLLAIAAGVPDVPAVWWLATTRFYADILHYLLMVGICQAVDDRRQQHDQELRSARLLNEIARARLQEMRLRLEPDLLLGALDEVEAAIARDPEEADRLVASLGDHLRRLLREETPAPSRSGEELRA
jgi:two-component system LytT family sensor kinase